METKVVVLMDGGQFAFVWFESIREASDFIKNGVVGIDLHQGLQFA